MRDLFRPRQYEHHRIVLRPSTGNILLHETPTVCPKGTDMRKTFTVKRQADVDLIFSGECLVRKSSLSGRRQTRWTEIRIYRTVSSGYVAEIVGRSVLPGEIDRIKVTVHDSPVGLRDALKTRPDEALTELAQSALREAAFKDAAIACELTKGDTDTRHAGRH